MPNRQIPAVHSIRQENLGVERVKEVNAIVDGSVRGRIHLAGSGGIGLHRTNRRLDVDFKRTPKWRRVLKRVALYSASLVVAAVLFGFVTQLWKDRHVLTTHAPPGSFMKVDGHKIHFRTRGEGKFTFVLEAGLGDYSGSWGALEVPLAEIGKVFVYDRAGLGWSEEGPQPRSAEQITTELHHLLAAAKIGGPVILVGHSLGGLTQTLYAIRYPDDVAGLLLIDPSHKDQIAKLPSAPMLLGLVMTQISRTAPFGLPQLLMRALDPIVNQTKHIETTGAELRAFLNSPENWGTRPLDLGHTPITVLTAGAYRQFPGKTESESKAIWGIWCSLHEELVAASASPIRKHEVVGGAYHYIHRTHPEAVINAAREMIGQINAQVH